MINQPVNQRYEALEKVGESPLSAVYKARDKVGNRVVAVKVIQPPYASDTEFLNALQAGLTAAAALNHPGIAHFYEFDEADGTPYAAVEFVRGINLKERIRRIAPFTLSVAVDFACAIGEALRYAHAAGQAHGDLRPQNIIVSPEGAVKITDFGVQPAVARSPEAQRALLPRVAPYHAPELSTAQPGSVSGDIYALGAILYEMLTGAPVFSGDTPEAIAEQHAFGEIPSPRAMNPGVPRSVEGIILKCLQKQPAQRYQTATDLLADLKAVRDALRFGKSLSWSPIDLDTRPASVSLPTAAATAPAPVAVAVPTASVPSRDRTLEPVAEVAASSAPPAMTTNNRLRAQDERVSIYIKIALGTVTVIIVACLIGFVGLWSSNWVVPSPVSVPNLVGKPIDQVRDILKSMKVRPIEFGQYTDKPRNIVYKTDLDPGAQIRPNHYIRVWYSKGPEYVNVPRVTHLSKEEAEQKLKEAGLMVGKIITAYHDTIPENTVISQNVSSKKRVFHDTPVDLVVSDGPKPEYATASDTNDTPPSDSNANDPAANGDTNAANPTVNGTGADNTPPDQPSPKKIKKTAPDQAINAPAAPSTPEESTADNQTEHRFDRTINIPKDGRGERQVKIEYVDALGPGPISAVDEPHDAGDRIPLSFTYYGKNITLRIYYDDKLVWERKFDPEATKHQRIR